MTPREPAVDTTPLQVHLVPHTHWDREWYHVAPRFRQRLVALVDALLQGPPSARTPFLLDGQAITLRDYLAVRPDGEPRLREALRSGMLEAGPWFVLGDNLIPSGEAIVRNLEAGRRVLRHLGATPPAVAYCPDTFGHPAALPLLAAGFGLPVAVVWRGAGGAAHPTTDLWWWESADGSRVLTHHLPPDGYEFGSALPEGEAAARARWERLATLFAERTASGVALLLNGADHHARQPALARAVDALQRAAGPAAVVRLSSLGAWSHALLAAATHRDLPVVQGELRDSYGYTWTLGGTYATRAHQKRRNARLERGLLRDVEPWLALARLHRPSADSVRHDAQLSMAQLPALLHRTWEDLLATHPHDTLCGCSTDAVARSMDVQQELVAEQGKGLREAALQVVLQHDAVAARDRRDFDWRRLVLRNRAPRPRGGLAFVHLEYTVADAPVGPNSFPVVPASIPPASAAEASVVPASALPTQAILAQPLASRLRFSRRESPQHYPDNDLVRDHHMLLWVPSVPPLGVDAWDAPRWNEPVPAPAFPVAFEQRATTITVNNGRLMLRIETDAAEPVATLVVDDRELRGVLTMETQRDEGDSYTPSLRGDVETLQCVGARLVHEGPLRATVRLWWRTRRATAMAEAASAKRTGPIRLTTDLHVDAMSPALQCDVRGNNHRTDHRLQLVWHTDVHDGRVWADAAFGPVLRPVVTAPGDAREAVPDGLPMHRWVMHANPMFGATLIADGHAEAAVRDGRLALTLLRAVRELSRADLPERPGHAGWPSPTPLAQCQGPFAARTALYLHGPMSDDVLSRVRDVCDDVLFPLVGDTWRDLAWAGQCSGPALVGEAFELSAVTVSQSHSDTVVLRLVNTTHRRAWGAVHLPPGGPWICTHCRLDETPVASPHVVEREYGFDAGPREVVTLLVRPATSSS